MMRTLPFSFITKTIGGVNVLGINVTTRYPNAVNHSNIFGKLVIPRVINGLRIDEIGKDAFVNLTFITEVVIEAEIRQINERSFGHMSGLERINVPASVVHISYCGIHAYNETSGGTSHGELVVTFPPDTQIKYLDKYSISRKQRIVIYFLGDSSPSHNNDPFFYTVAEKIVIYAPRLKYFCGVKTRNIISCRNHHSLSIRNFFAPFLLSFLIVS